MAGEAWKKKRKRWMRPYSSLPRWRNFLMRTMVKKRKRVDDSALLEPTTVEEVIPPVSTVYIAPVACDWIPAPAHGEQNEHEETSCPELDPKHKVFLSHSGVEKPFVGKLCKLLEEHQYYPFFDQRSDSLLKGKEFASLIIEAAKTCQVAVVVLSEDYLSSKWPMIELSKFVWARKSRNKNLNLLPLFYKASVADLNDTSIKDKWMPKWIKLAQADSRVDPQKWAEAVRKLRRSNGIEFRQFESKVSYRDAIIKAIFKLAPPDLPYDMSDIHGGNRICKILANNFQQHPKTNASVLGLYGMGGLGKTTISKCLCNHLIQEFLGRVCYIEMNNKSMNAALARQKVVMKKLLRLAEPIMEDILDVSQGWNILKKRMKENPVFLIIDNVQPGEEQEARAYLDIKYNSLSKIMVVSRSLDVVEKLLGDQKYCCRIPRLKRKEAIGILLQHEGQNLEYSYLNKEDRGIVEGCVEEACFHDLDVNQNTAWHESGGRQYHPLAIKSLGAYLEERRESCGVSAWVAYLGEYRELKRSGDCYDALFEILGLYFSTLDKIRQLMFLDIVLYARIALPLISNSELEDMEIWLVNIHDVSRAVVKQRIAHFKNLGMLKIEEERIFIHDLYKDYAKWVVKHVVNKSGLVGVWREEFINDGQVWFRSVSFPAELQSSPSGSCWQELRRISLFCISFHNFAERRFQEWRNVVVLQLQRCDGVSTLDLQSLTCLRHLELYELPDLETLILTEDDSTSYNTVAQACRTVPKMCSRRPWLQYVQLKTLDSLRCLPSFSSFTSLKYLGVQGCKELMNPPMVQNCVNLRRMELDWFPQQETLPNLDGLMSLQDLRIRGPGYVQQQSTVLKLEGLSSLISLESLDLRFIPVGDLNGLEQLKNVENIQMWGLYNLEDLDPLESLARSSLHILGVYHLVGEHAKRLEARVRHLQQLIFQNHGSDQGWSLAEWNELTAPRRALKEVYYEFEDDSTSSLSEPPSDLEHEAGIESEPPSDLEHEAGIESENFDEHDRAAQQYSDV